jgi:hypothetical protein
VSSTSNGLRVRRLRLIGTLGNDRTYDVSFLDDSEQWRPFSIIAGASQTGKSSTIDYLRYCLGDSEYPDFDEMVNNVSAAVLEIELDGAIFTIERPTIGSPSKFASVWAAPIGSLRDAAERRLPIEPPSDPESLSQFLLASFGLSDIKLPVSPSKPESDTHALSIRDVFRVMFFENSRLDNQNLVLENGNPIVAQKFQQTIDLMFGVADDSISQLADRIRAAEGLPNNAEATAKNLHAIVEAEYPDGPAGVEILHIDAQARVVAERARVRELDDSELQQQDSARALRASLIDAERVLDEWDIRLKNRVSLVDRLSALALQYSDDKRKLIFLKQAEKLFDPLQVTTCPACLSELVEAPHLEHGNCSLCGHIFEPTEIGGSSGGVESVLKVAGSSPLIDRELTSTSRRLDQLADYLGRLQAEYRSFELSRERARATALEASDELANITKLPTPYLAYRDQLTQRLSVAEKDESQLALGLRLWERVAEADAESALRAGQLAQLRRERRDIAQRPDRGQMVASLSARFAHILGEFDYPKLSDAWLNSSLVPTVRGLTYSKASSGGLTLISIAWALAVWEVAFEQDALAPGLLVIDSPEKNLGHKANQADPDFADARLVDNVYSHVNKWLQAEGQGAQLIFVDNTPPQGVEASVVVRFTGNPSEYPFGLIDNATS